MAVLIANSGNKIVDTIADRNALEQRFEGMQVVVRDAIADVIVGIGEAGYQWSESAQKWMLMWKTTRDELIFTTEVKTIVSGQVSADYYPQNSLVWGCSIRDSNNIILGDIEPNVALNVISLGTNAYDGHTLHYTYAHGTALANPNPIDCGKF